MSFFQDKFLTYICPYLRAVNPKAKVMCTKYRQQNTITLHKDKDKDSLTSSVQAAHLLLLAKAKWFESQKRAGKDFERKMERASPTKRDNVDIDV